MVLPLFPLGPVVYTPGSTQTLNIFEPRYRKMYSDILMSGGRRFVTTMVNPDASGEPELAEVGVVLYLEDLKEVSEQTNDAVKYICSHKVLDSRVEIRSVLNPGDGATRDTYMRCEVREIDDADADADVAELEAAVSAALLEVAALQEANKEDVRFSKSAVEKLAAGRGVGAGSLWSVVELWKNFLEARAQAAARKAQKDVQDRLMTFLADQNGDGDSPSSVNLSELPPGLRRDVQGLRDRVMDDVEPLVREQTAGVQHLLQATTHADRLRKFETMVANEKQRLVARAAFKKTLASLEDQFKKDT